MKIVAINLCHYGSTGHIMLQIADLARKRGHEVYTFSRAWRGQPPAPEGHAFFGTFFDNMIHHTVGPFFGKNEMLSARGTRALIRRLEEISPDLIHLHNLHGWYLNAPMLFDYIRKRGIRVIWTLHDCWVFTGNCCYFTAVGCEKWRDGCHDCPIHRAYPGTRSDVTDRMWQKKREWFSDIPDMTLVAPSHWLSGLVRESFLKEYPMSVIHNGIDLSVFRPRENDFRRRYGCEDKYILLGVALGWGARKGTDVFVELARRLDPSYQIVLVGTDDDVDRTLPSNIISIHRTHNQEELAEIYTAADLFVNPTREEVMGLVNVEALACGTPVVTFNTGGSPECIDESCGSVVPCDDVEALLAEILRIRREAPYTKEDCMRRARAFAMQDRYDEYLALYEEAGG